MQNVNKTEQSSMTAGQRQAQAGPCVRDHCASDLEGKVVVMLRLRLLGATAPCTAVAASTGILPRVLEVHAASNWTVA
jgi:hypothetical protein